MGMTDEDIEFVKQLIRKESEQVPFVSTPLLSPYNEEEHRRQLINTLRYTISVRHNSLSHEQYTKLGQLLDALGG